MKDAQILLKKEEFVSGMEQRLNYAKVWDAQTLSSKEECASGMEQIGRNASNRYALLIDAQILPSKEECATGMEQRPSDVAAKDAQI